MYLSGNTLSGNITAGVVAVAVVVAVTVIVIVIAVLVANHHRAKMSIHQDVSRFGSSLVPKLFMAPLTKRLGTRLVWEWLEHLSCTGSSWLISLRYYYYLCACKKIFNLVFTNASSSKHVFYNFYCYHLSLSSMM